MEVICKRGTKRLVSGAKYTAIKLQNSKSYRGSGRLFSGRISIIGFGSFTAKNFKQIDGTDLPEIDWVDASYKTNIENDGWANRVNKDAKVGDIVIFRNTNNQFLQQDKKYKVSDVDPIRNRIKVLGYKSWVSGYQFRKCPSDVSRDITIASIFDEVSENFSCDGIRKIDRLSKEDREKLVLEILIKSYIDKYRNNMSVIEWAIKKTGYSDKVTADDFDSIMNRKISDIISE